MLTISIIILSLLGIVGLFFAFRSAIRHDDKITFFRKNEVLQSIRYTLPQQLDFAYHPFHDAYATFAIVIVIITIMLYPLPLDMPVPFLDVAITFKAIISIAVLYLLMREHLHAIIIYGLRKTPALSLNHQRFQIFGKDIEWSSILDIILEEDDEGYGLTVNYKSNKEVEIVKQTISFTSLKDSCITIMPAIEKYWRTFSGRPNSQITYLKNRG